MGSLLEAVRDRTRTVDLKQVNRVLLQPHWREREASWRRYARPHPQIHLPALDAGYALTLVEILERLTAAAWRAHGDRMTDLLEPRAAARRAKEPEYVDDGDPDAPDDTPF